MSARHAINPNTAPWGAAEGFFTGLAEPVRRRHPTFDVHRPDDSGGRLPAVIFVHGGPIPEDAVPTPRDSAVFTGYGALAASAGLAGITFDHRLHSAEHYPIAADDVAAVVDRVRDADDVDPDRVALWCFSGGGVLAADLLRAAPSWLRAIAWTYPVLAPPADRPGDVERFDCVGSVGAAPDLPKLLVRVGAEYPLFRETQDAFVEAATALEVIDLPEAPHGYEVHGDNPACRRPTDRAMAWVAGRLQTG